MGRKGVSKRKSPKSKAPTVSGTSGVISTLAREPVTRAPQLLGNGEAISSGKSGKKKSSGARSNDKKR